MNNIDDDALLAGLPSWNDRIPSRPQHEESNISLQPTLPSTSTTTKSVTPTVKTLTEEEVKRMELRMAALRTLKSRGKKQKEAITASSSLKSMEPTGTLTPPAPTYAPSVDDTSSERAVASKNVYTTASKTSNSRLLEYTDVDAPDMDTADPLLYGNEVLTDHGNGRVHRQRISYADEFSTRPQAHVGDVGTDSWIDRTMGPVQASRPTPKPRLANTDTSSEVTYRPIKPLPTKHAPIRRFVNEPLWASMVIEWSDDEDEEETAGRITPVYHASMPRADNKQEAANTDKEKSEINPSIILSEKEKQIRSMQARIQALEERKKQQLQEQGRITAHENGILGKRVMDLNGDLNMEGEPVMPISHDSKVGDALEYQCNTKRTKLNEGSSLNWLKTRFASVCFFFSTISGVNF